jgi:hypothetical protein
MMNKILHQYQDKIPPGLGFRVLGQDGSALFPEGISPEDLAGNYDSYMVLDSTAGSKQADRDVRNMVYQAMLTNPLMMQNPSGFWKLTADLIKSTGLYEDVEDILGPRPPSAQQGSDPQEENNRMMQGEVVPVNDTDNVIEHLIAHYTFRGTADFAMMPPEYRMNFDEHMQETKGQVAKAAQQMVQQTQEQGQQQPNQGGAPNIAPPGGMNGGPNQGTPMGAPPVAGMGNTPPPIGAGAPGIGQEAGIQGA